MRMRILFFLSILALVFLSACSAGNSSSTPVPVGDESSVPQASESQIEENETSSPENPVKDNIPSSPPQNMVAFDGEVFVTTTELVADLWRMSGWNVSDAPVDTDQDSTPLDCTLYPHAGVMGQWVGGCRGHVLIPRNGSPHIAVIVTLPDGSTQVVQVAPDPNNPYFQFIPLQFRRINRPIG